MRLTGTHRAHAMWLHLADWGGPQRSQQGICISFDACNALQQPLQELCIVFYRQSRDIQSDEKLQFLTAYALYKELLLLHVFRLSKAALRSAWQG